MWCFLLVQILSHIYDGNEQPNPMPNYSRTGNPISIQFYTDKPIQLKRFKLYDEDGEVKETHLMDRGNDPHNLLTNKEFALFPIKPLRYNHHYRVELDYTIAGKPKSLMWTFHTRRRTLTDFI